MEQTPPTELLASTLAGRVTEAIDGYPGDAEDKAEIMDGVIGKLTATRELVAEARAAQ